MRESVRHPQRVRESVRHPESACEVSGKSAKKFEKVYDSRNSDNRQEIRRIANVVYIFPNPMALAAPLKRHVYKINLAYSSESETPKAITHPHLLPTTYTNIYINNSTRISE